MKIRQFVLSPRHHNQEIRYSIYRNIGPTRQICAGKITKLKPIIRPLDPHIYLEEKRHNITTPRSWLSQTSTARHPNISEGSLYKTTSPAEEVKKLQLSNCIWALQCERCRLLRGQNESFSIKRILPWSNRNLSTVVWKYSCPPPNPR